mmetsp:Transcript_10210/g.23299  ORF Transcript_10210/g.23299 Transcript_10210/m.23299 type:complete len:277 (+) Transcript_10210:1178-2008(+)|eukprot:756758-Hanusia_phi.AAC.5
MRVDDGVQLDLQPPDLVPELEAFSLDLVAHLLAVLLQLLDRGVCTLGKLQHRVPFDLELLHGLLQLRLAIQHRRVQADARVLDVRPHEEAVRTDHHPALSAEEGERLALVRVALSVAHRLHGRYYMRLEHGPLLGMAGLQAGLAVLDDTGDALHHSRLLLAHVALELLPDGGLLRRLPLLRSFELLHHVLQRKVQRQSLDAVGQGARCSTHRTVDGECGNSLVPPQASGAFEADIVGVATGEGPGICKQHETDRACELVFKILCQHCRTLATDFNW